MDSLPEDEKRVKKGPLTFLQFGDVNKCKHFGSIDTNAHPPGLFKWYNQGTPPPSESQMSKV